MIYIIKFIGYALFYIFIKPFIFLYELCKEHCPDCRYCISRPDEPVTRDTTVEFDPTGQAQPDQSQNEEYIVTIGETYPLSPENDLPHNNGEGPPDYNEIPPAYNDSPPVYDNGDRPQDYDIGNNPPTFNNVVNDPMNVSLGAQSNSPVHSSSSIYNTPPSTPSGTPYVDVIDSGSEVLPLFTNASESDLMSQPPPEGSDGLPSYVEVIEGGSEVFPAPLSPSQPPPGGPDGLPSYVEVIEGGSEVFPLFTNASDASDRGLH